VDYFQREGLEEGARVMELGCGWGLAGIYCAKKHRARVTGVDVDPAVFPYLKLHADINRVQIATMNQGFADLGGEHLKEVDVLIGADICFWDSLVNPLIDLILRAVAVGVRLVLIADPGRSSFEKIGRYFTVRRKGEVVDWTTQQPQRKQGRILKIETQGTGYKAQHAARCARREVERDGQAREVIRCS
jgi:predicted nicotinamide N-methyase